MTDSLDGPGVRPYFIGIVVGFLLSLAQAQRPRAAAGDPLLWLPWLLYGQVLVVWALALFVSPGVRAFLLLLAVLPALLLNAAYLVAIWPVHLIALVFLLVGIAKAFAARAAQEVGPLHGLPTQPT